MGCLAALVRRAGASDIGLVTRESAALVPPHIAIIAAGIDPFSASRHKGTSYGHRHHPRLQAY
jgi:hypothetical protein